MDPPVTNTSTDSTRPRPPLLPSANSSPSSPSALRTESSVDSTPLDEHAHGILSLLPTPSEGILRPQGFSPPPTAPRPAISTVDPLNPVPLPQPRPSQVSTARTPAAEPLLPDLAGGVASGLPLHPALETPPLARSVARHLRLPPFRSLGIGGASSVAEPSADPDLQTPEADELARDDIASPLSSPSVALVASAADIGGPSPVSSPDKTPGRGSIQHFILTTTPPEEREWAGMPTLMMAPGDSEESAHLPQQSSEIIPVDESAASAATGTEHRVNPDPSLTETVLPRILASLSTGLFRNPTAPEVRILTHALPVPDYRGHVFPALIPAIHALISAPQTTWISHWHAVSGRFNLADLPSSPPSTPAAPGEGDDYFTTRVFDSAVSVPDYQQAASITSHPQRPSASVVQSALLSPSPNPVVPPGILSVSVTERYIPPSSSAEFAGLFNPSSGRSLLSDRLIELTESSGHLIFIYPTRAGAETFVREYLGAVLDPLLRSMMVLRGMGSDICDRIGRMSAVGELLPFGEMELRLRSFCASISNHHTAGDRFQPFGASSPVSYEVVHASSAHVHLPAAVWSEWWCRQEKPRIRDVFEAYVRAQPDKARAASSFTGVGGNAGVLESRQRVREDMANDGGGSMSYLIEVLDGVREGALKRIGERHDVEVGVFIVRKKKEG